MSDTKGMTNEGVLEARKKDMIDHIRSGADVAHWSDDQIWEFAKACIKLHEEEETESDDDESECDDGECGKCSRCLPCFYACANCEERREDHDEEDGLCKECEEALAYCSADGHETCVYARPKDEMWRCGDIYYCCKPVITDKRRKRIHPPKIRTAYN